MLIVPHRAACLDPPMCYIRVGRTASSKTSFPIMTRHRPYHFTGNSQKFSKILPHYGYPEYTPVFFFFYCWRPWLLHNKVLPVRSQMNLVSSKSDKGRGHSAFKKISNFSRFLAQAPIFLTKTRLLTTWEILLRRVQWRFFFIEIRP